MTNLLTMSRQSLAPEEVCHERGFKQKCEQLQIMLEPEELRAVDDFRYKYRMPSRAAAVRELLKRGLTSAPTDRSMITPVAGFGVLGIVTAAGLKTQRTPMELGRISHAGGIDRVTRAVASRGLRGRDLKLPLTLRLRMKFNGRGPVHGFENSEYGPFMARSFETAARRF